MNDTKKLEYINFIRVMATLLIVCCHYSVSFIQYSINGFNNYLLNFANSDSGKLGVLLFFLISGFGLAYKYENKDFKVSEYYKSRISKIFPLLYITWIIFYVYKLIVLDNIVNMGVWRIIWTLLGIDYYVGGLTPTYALVGEWFTGAIILIYLLFPFILFFYKRYPILLFVLFYFLWLSDCYIRPLPHVTNTESLFVDIFYFITGMLLCKERNKLQGIPLYAVFVALIPLFFVSNSFHVMINSLAISICIVIATMHFEFKRISENFLYKLILKYSYIIYLIHHMIIYAFMEHFRNETFSLYMGWGLLLVIIFTIICCYHLIYCIQTYIKNFLIFVSSMKLFWRDRHETLAEN